MMRQVRDAGVSRRIADGVEHSLCDKDVTRWTVCRWPTSVVGWSHAGDDVLRG